MQRRETIRQDSRFCYYTAVLEWYFSRDLGAQIEALVLARMASTYVSNQLGLAPEAVDCYCTLCFDVQSRLDDAAYIMREAIASERRLGNPATAQRRTTMKLMAYHCGPQVLMDLYGINATNGTWVCPTDHIRRQAALTALDQSVDRLISAAAGGPLRFDDLEACLGAIEPYLSDRYTPSKNEWLMHLRPGDASPKFAEAPKAVSRRPPPSPIDWYPQKDFEAASTRLAKLRHEEEELKAKNPTYGRSGINLSFCVSEAVKQVESLRRIAERHRGALEVRQSFLGLLTTRAPGFDGPGIDANWNVNVFDSNVEVADWAQRQIEERNKEALVESTLFVEDGSKVRLADGIAMPNSPIVVLGDCGDDTPAAFFAGEWTCASWNLIRGVLCCRDNMHLRGRNRGVVMAAANSREAAAWRRLGLAAIPVPVAGIWPAAANTFWTMFDNMCHDLPRVDTSGNHEPQINAPPAVLTVSTLDPATLTSRPDVEWRRSAHALRAVGPVLRRRNGLRRPVEAIRGFDQRRTRINSRAILIAAAGCHPTKFGERTVVPGRPETYARIAVSAVIRPPGDGNHESRGTARAQGQALSAAVGRLRR